MKKKDPKANLVGKPVSRDSFKEIEGKGSAALEKKDLAGFFKNVPLQAPHPPVFVVGEKEFAHYEDAEKFFDQNADFPYIAFVLRKRQP